jgi:hypothetical protein
VNGPPVPLRQASKALWTMRLLVASTALSAAGRAHGKCEKKCRESREVGMAR